MKISILFRIVLLVSSILNSDQQKCLTPLEDCSRDKVSFFLYTKANERPQELILSDPTTLKNAIFNKQANFKFIIHGYTQSKDTPMMAKLREEYFKTNTWNIIYIDYQTLAIQGCYLGTATPSAPQIGQCAATLLKILLSQRWKRNQKVLKKMTSSRSIQVLAQCTLYMLKMIKIDLFRIVILIPLISDSDQQKCLIPLKDCSRDKISFFLYTASNELPQELILSDPATLKNAVFVNNANFKFIVHGYTQSKDSSMMAKLREEYFKTNTWNIIYTDYQPLAIKGCYLSTATPSAPQIGQCAATLLKILLSQRPDITIDKFHFIGFSLGAQICAQISNNLQPLKIPRITGCDPAFPGFFGGTQVSINILNKQHAKFVDVIHTNMGISGVYLSDAHYDIYVDDGTFQPGCDKDPVCSHARALQIFTESINSPVKFIAGKCDSYYIWFTMRGCEGDRKLKIQVGEHCSPPKNAEEMGLYQFNTNDKPPFALGFS